MTTEHFRPAGTASLPPPPETVIFQLLADLAAAPNDASALHMALETTTHIVPCEQAFFCAWDVPSGRPEMHCNAATDQAFFASYVSHFHSVDPFACQGVQQRSIEEHRSLGFDDVLTPSTLRHTPFHLRFLAPHGDLTHGLCRYATLDEDRRTSLHLFRRSDQAPFSYQERELIDLLHTQLTIQLRLRNTLAAVRRERDALRAGMDLMNQPIFLLDAQASVITCNQAAKQLTREGRQLRISDGRMLPGRLTDHASWVAPALHQLHPSGTRSHLQALPSKRKEQPHHYGILSLLDNHHSDNAATALLTLVDTQQPAPRHTLDSLMRTFEFTAAQARIADALMADMNTQDISNTFLIRRDTVRCHIKRLLAKTGTHGHADLQKMLLRISPNFTTLRQKPVS